MKGGLYKRGPNEGEGEEKEKRRRREGEKKEKRRIRRRRGGRQGERGKEGKGEGRKKTNESFHDFLIGQGRRDRCGELKGMKALIFNLIIQQGIYHTMLSQQRFALKFLGHDLDKEMSFQGRGVSNSSMTCMTRGIISNQKL